MLSDEQAHRHICRSELDTLTAVGAVIRLLRRKRLETIMVGSARKTIVLLIENKKANDPCLRPRRHARGQNKVLKSNDLYFRDLQECIWFCQETTRQSPAISSHCLPVIDPKK